MKIKGRLLKKLLDEGIEIEEVEKKYPGENGELEIVKKDQAKFPCARDFIPLVFSEQVEMADYIASGFESFKFIKDFEAIWSPKLEVIECGLQSGSRFVLPNGNWWKKLCGALGDDTDETSQNPRFEFDKSEENISVSIGTASLQYAILTFLKDQRERYEYVKRRVTIRIEISDISTHDQAKSALEKIGNSVLFKLDLTASFGFNLAEDREIRRAYSKRVRYTYDLDRSLPRFEYDNEPMSLYWYARSANTMPLLQFLALYQILEFYFPMFSMKDAHQKIKNLIKDPRFNPDRDSDITGILTTINQNQSQSGYGSELEQLKSTISNCTSSDELREEIEFDQNMFEYYSSKKPKGLASKSINLANKSADLVMECAERIYEIRCRVVHAKSSDKNNGPLLPSSPELKQLVFDISILEIIAKKVLVATSRQLKI